MAEQAENTESRGVTRGPFRATNLWNELVTCFRAGMPLRKHWQGFKRYNACFTARAAVDCLHEQLKSNNNFRAEVTRQQAVKLLRKFLLTHVIENIRGRWGSENLEDDRQLFRFPTTSPLQTVKGAQPESRNVENISRRKRRFLQLPSYLEEFLRSVSIR